MDQGYLSLRQQSQAFGEERDCGVIALAALLNIPYYEAHAALQEAGRKNFKGTYMHQMEEAAENLGYGFRELGMWELEEWFRRTPKSARCRLGDITLGAVDKYRDRFADRRYLLMTPKHFVALIDGNAVCWAKGSKRVIRRVWVLEEPRDVERV